MYLRCTFRLSAWWVDQASWTPLYLLYKNSTILLGKRSKSIKVSGYFFALYSYCKTRYDVPLLVLSYKCVHFLVAFLHVTVASMLLVFYSAVKLVVGFLLRFLLMRCGWWLMATVAGIPNNWKGVTSLLSVVRRWKCLVYTYSFVLLMNLRLCAVC